MAILSEEIIRQGSNGPGGWNKHQLEMLDITWPPQRGWLEGLVGKEFPRWKVDEFLRRKGEVGRKMIKRMTAAEAEEALIMDRQRFKAEHIKS